MFSRNETFPVHCRPLQGPPASGVFFMISNSDSEKGWVFFVLKQESGGGCTRFNLFNVLVALYLYFHLCILLCQHEVVSPLGNPGLLGASMCLWYCICKYMFVALYLWLCICVFVFVYLSLAARGGESFGKSRITRGLRREENSDQLYNNLQMRAFAQPLSLHRWNLDPWLSFATLISTSSTSISIKIIQQPFTQPLSSCVA